QLLAALRELLRAGRFGLLSLAPALLGQLALGRVRGRDDAEEALLRGRPSGPRRRVVLHGALALSPPRRRGSSPAPPPSASSRAAAARERATPSAVRPSGCA